MPKMTSALKLKPDKELAKLVGRHIICTEKARRRKKEQSLVRNITLSLPFMVWLHGSNVVHNPRGWGWVGRLVQGCGRTLTTTPIYSLDGQSLIDKINNKARYNRIDTKYQQMAFQSVPAILLFWIWSNIVRQI